MRYERCLTRQVGLCLFSVLVLIAMATNVSGQAGQTPKRFLTAPLTIEDQGSFFIGGVQKVTNHATVPPPPAPGTTPAPAPVVATHQITIGQMYVQFQIPARKYGAGWPVIMVHGSTHTGACLESTPDGREGWYPYFVRKGVPSYVVDQAGRGRSGFDESKQLVPNAEVTLPGSTCSACDPAAISPANTWTPQNLASLVERLGGAIVVTHSQSGIMGHHMARILKERGHLGLLKGLITLEGSCSLPNSGLTAADFDGIPYMALKGDYTGTSMVCQDTVNAINARRASRLGTAKAEYLKLDEMGMLSVTHMMMLDKRNLEIADVIFGWVNRNVRGSGERVRSTN